MNPQAWLHKQLLKLHAIEATPHAIALGFAVGTFFGFMPLFGVKTLLSILFAWILRTNKVAAIVGVTLHDLILPFAPLLLRLEFKIGFWVLSNPHHFPPKLRMHRQDLHALMSWTKMLTTGGPLLLGSVILAIPFTVGAYFILRRAVIAYRARRAQASSNASLRNG
jgi:uncharacterized protein (TIGR03546 family)